MFGRFEFRCYRSGNYVVIQLPLSAALDIEIPDLAQEAIRTFCDTTQRHCRRHHLRRPAK